MAEDRDRPGVDRPVCGQQSGMTTTADTDRQTLLILGASGDLTARLLLPGLGRLVAAGGPAGLSLLGSGAQDWDDEVPPPVQ